MTLLYCGDLGDPAAPAVLFISGMAGSSASWTAPFRELSVRWRLLLVDVLGFGRSPKPVTEYSLDEHLETLHATVQSRASKPVHIVGYYSMGALLGLAYAARYPQGTVRVALLAMPWYRNETEARQIIAQSSLFNRWLALETPLAHAPAR